MSERIDVRDLVFVMEKPFVQRDYERLGRDLLLARGFRVQFIDISEHIRTKTYSDLSKFVEQKKNSLWVVLFGPTPVTLPLFKIFKALNIVYAQFGASDIPGPMLTFAEKVLRLIKNLNLTTLSAKWNRFLFNFFVAPARLLKGPAYVLAGGAKSGIVSAALSKDAQVIWSHTLDYDLYLKMKNGSFSAEEKNFCVFLDEYIPFHPDYDMHAGMDPNVDPWAYYNGMDRVFRVIESELKMPVIIAAHPKSKYDTHPDYYHGRKIEYGKTIDLVAAAKLVLTHASTSVNFPVMFRKPLLFLTSDALAKAYEGPYIEAFAAQFGKRPINVDHFSTIDFKNEMIVHEPYYAAYMKNYVKRPDTPEKPFWDIFADAVLAVS